MSPHLLWAVLAPEKQQSPGPSAPFSFAAGTSDEAKPGVMLPITKLEIRLQGKKKKKKTQSKHCSRMCLSSKCLLSRFHHHLPNASSVSEQCFSSTDPSPPLLPAPGQH